jgi:hypothetical protein
LAGGRESKFANTGIPSARIITLESEHCEDEEKEVKKQYNSGNPSERKEHFF